MEDARNSSGAHVAVFAFPFGTHAPPLLSLVRMIAVAAPTAAFSFFSTATSNAKVFEVGGFENIKAYDVEDGVPEGHVCSGHPTEEIGLFLAAAGENFRRGIETAVAERGRKVTCMMSDAFLCDVGKMAEAAAVPWVPMWMSGPWPLAAHLCTDEIRNKIGTHGIEGREDETIGFISGLSAIRLRDLQEGIITGDLDSPFSSMLYKMGHELPLATAVAISSFEELDTTITDYLKSKFHKLFHIGLCSLLSPPPTNTDKYKCISWLDKQAPSSVAYICFGSTATPPPDELVAIAEALEESATPFLWSLKDNYKVHLPKGFVEKTSEYGKIVPWTPQVQVLGHSSTGAFVTHCGWNSLLENIVGGVPMICRPFFGDHSLNCRMVEAVWGIGVTVENGVFTKCGLKDSLTKILLHDDGKKMRENITSLKKMANASVGPNGSCVENLRELVSVVTMVPNA